MKAVMTAEAIDELVRTQFAQIEDLFKTVHVGDGEVSIRLLDDGTERHLRPGGTISGPTQMMMADTAAYFLVLSLIGPVPLAVTTHLSINFMRKPPPGELDAHARILKLGKRLAVSEVVIGDRDEPVAHAQVTYSIPPPDKR
ncbi:MAG: PaaI family thioesterase [Myxococcota bacterium]